MKKLKFTLFLIVSLLFLNCEKEQETFIEQEKTSIKQDNKLSQQLASEFNKEDFAKVLPYNYTVDWSTTNKSFSDELELFYYEFSITYVATFNPDALNKNRKTGYYNKHKIVVTEDDDKKLTFYMARFYEEINTVTKKAYSSEVSFKPAANYTGLVHLLNREDQMVYAKRIAKGEVVESKLFFTKKDKRGSLAERVVETCITVTTYHYIDYYNKRDGYDEFSHRVDLPTTTETTCDFAWYPDAGSSSGGGGYGAGTYSGTGQNNNNCDGECLHKVVDEIEKPKTLEELEQDYRGQMSDSEEKVFNTLTKSQQYDYLISGYDAIQKSKELFPSKCQLRNGKGDAFRHAYWNALSTRKLGKFLTNQLTSAHEERSDVYAYNRKEREMDLFNNKIGQGVGASNNSNLSQEILNKVNNGELKYLNNLNPNNCEATYNSSLIKTNQ